MVALQAAKHVTDGPGQVPQPLAMQAKVPRVEVDGKHGGACLEVAGGVDFVLVGGGKERGLLGVEVVWAASLTSLPMTWTWESK